MKELPFANALAFVSGTISLVCLLGVAFARDAFMALANSFFHGVDLSVLPAKEITLGSAITGFITIVVGAWIIGWLFAYCYNWCDRKFR